MRHKAYTDEQRQYRIHYDSDSDDIASGTGGALKPGRHHAPRPVSRAEVRFRLEQDGEWVTGQATLKKQGKWLDKGVWADWLADMDSQRGMRRRSGQSDASETGYTSLNGGAKLGDLPRNPSRSALRPKAAKVRISVLSLSLVNNVTVLPAEKSPEANHHLASLFAGGGP